MTRPDSCSAISAALDEPLPGTAPLARAWVVVEDPGPWGRDALRDSALPAPLVDHCLAAADHGVRTIVARHAARRHLRPGDPRNVWLASCSPTDPQLRHALLPSLDAITDWDLAALAVGHFPADTTIVDEAMEFVCTHSGRDACCALLGRARADRINEQHGSAWECSHLGGHRFAATALHLPSGNVFGRLGPSDALDTEHLRGASPLPPALQAAEIAVRRFLGADPWYPLRTSYADPAPTGEHDPVTAQIVDSRGRTWLVRCEAHTIDRPASCHKEATRDTMWIAGEVVGEMR